MRLALFITRYDESGSYELAAVVAIIILVVNLAVKAAVFAATNLMKKRARAHLTQGE